MFSSQKCRYNIPVAITSLMKYVKISGNSKAPNVRKVNSSRIETDLFKCTHYVTFRIAPNCFNLKSDTVEIPIYQCLNRAIIYIVNK